MSQVDERIDPCPFCGGESWVRDVGNLWEAFCNNPDCAAQPEVVKFTKEKAVAAWEDRSSNGSSSPVAASYVDEDGPVAKALCELKAAADYIQKETDSTLGAGRMHRLADEAADSIGLEIREST